MRAVLLALCLATAGCAQGGMGGACGLTQAGEVPVSLRAGRPFVDITAGGAQASFLVDTGAVVTLVQHSAVARFHLAMIEGGATQLQGLNGPAVTQVAVLTGARLGGLALDTMKVPVPSDAQATIASDLGGIIGMDVLGRYEMDFDMPAGRIRFYAGSPCDGEALPFAGPLIDIRGAWAPQPSLNDRDPRMYVQGTLNGRGVVAMLDSGSQRSVLYADMAAGLGITAEMLARDPAVTLLGIGETRIRAPSHRIDEARFGAASMRALEVLVVPRAYTNDSAMILGMDYLAHNRVWIAPRRRAAYVAAAR